jgi:hypothetical protein
MRMWQSRSRPESRRSSGPSGAISGARGAVLWCAVHDDDDQAVIEIDERELSIEEFGRLLKTYAGWGMRISFVPEDELDEARSSK